MTTFIKAKLKKSDDQTNIDNYRVAAKISEYHIKINLPQYQNSKIHDDIIIPCKKCLNGRTDFLVPNTEFEIDILTFWY